MDEQISVFLDVLKSELGRTINTTEISYEPIQLYKEEIMKH